MQTFLPYPDFHKSAQVLDRQRLGKQRVETLQILKALAGASSGWTNHPATRMWRGFEGRLLGYGLVMCDEWTRRGYQDTCADKMTDLYTSCDFGNDMGNPAWLGDGAFHASHRSNLKRKDPDHYKMFSERDDLPYIWPV